MCKQLFVFLIVLCSLSVNVYARSDNPFAKNDVFNIGKDVAWDVDKKAVQATKTASDDKGSFYHLQFDNKVLKLFVTSDSAGLSAKKFNQFEIRNVKIDGKTAPLFQWCLKNQERHDRFLQQGLSVKNDICSIDGAAGSFVLRLNKSTLAALQSGKRLSIMLKPFRTTLELNYDISDFKDMFLVLNAKPAPVVAPVAATPKTVKTNRKCWAGAPPKYSQIKSVEYDCDDASAKLDAESWVTKLVNKEKGKEKKLALEKEKQRKLTEEKKQKELAVKLRQEELLQAEAAAVAASEAKQTQIGNEITQKMLGVCQKYWDKGQHRCYCQKYIENAPKSIQESSTCG